MGKLTRKLVLWLMNWYFCLQWNCLVNMACLKIVSKLPQMIEKLSVSTSVYTLACTQCNSFGFQRLSTSASYKTSNRDHLPPKEKDDSHYSGSVCSPICCFWVMLSFSQDEFFPTIYCFLELRLIIVRNITAWLVVVYILEICDSRCRGWNICSLCFERNDEN